MKILFLWPNVNSYWAQKIKLKGIDVDNAFYNYGIAYGAMRKLLASNNIGLYMMLGEWKKDIFGYDMIIIQASEITIHIPEWLRKSGYNGRVIYWYWDPVSGSVNPEKININTCEIWTFDKEDSKKYGLIFNDTFFLFDEDMIDDNLIDQEVLFVGRDKGRIAYLNALGELLKMNNITYKFHIVPTKPYSINARKLNKMVSYSDVIKMVSHSEILLDINQEGQSGLSQRCMEALYFNKKIITNNEYIIDYPLYDRNLIYIIKKNVDVKDLIDFIRADKKKYLTDVRKYYDFSSWLKRMC